MNLDIVMAGRSRSILRLLLKLLLVHATLLTSKHPRASLFLDAWPSHSIAFSNKPVDGRRVLAARDSPFRCQPLTLRKRLLFASIRASLTSTLITAQMDDSDGSGRGNRVASSPRRQLMVLLLGSLFGAPATAWGVSSLTGFSWNEDDLVQSLHPPSVDRPAIPLPTGPDASSKANSQIRPEEATLVEGM
jgi:hypothetical protein